MADELENTVPSEINDVEVDELDESSLEGVAGGASLSDDVEHINQLQCFC